MKINSEKNYFSFQKSEIFEKKDKKNCKKMLSSQFWGD